MKNTESILIRASIIISFIAIVISAYSIGRRVGIENGKSQCDKEIYEYISYRIEVLQSDISDNGFTTNLHGRKKELEKLAEFVQYTR